MSIGIGDVAGQEKLCRLLQTTVATNILSFQAHEGYYSLPGAMLRIYQRLSAFGGLYTAQCIALGYRVGLMYTQCATALKGQHKQHSIYCAGLIMCR